jgi:hypothetical protein
VPGRAAGGELDLALFRARWGGYLGWGRYHDAFKFACQDKDDVVTVPVHSHQPGDDARGRDLRRGGQ